MSKILLVGATGLVGQQVLQLLTMQNSANELSIISRRSVDNLPIYLSQHVAEPSEWPRRIAAIAPDILINCLGTTIKIAGSNSAFAAVDLELVNTIGRAAQTAGAKHMITVSSVGANAYSANFYLSTKGKAELALRAIGFQRLDIIQPGLLRGDRAERRQGESLGIMLSPLTDAIMHGPLRRFRSIDSATVARAIANLVSAGGAGTYIHENEEITALAG